MTRLVTASVATIVVGLLAVGLWVVGQAQYTNDYCRSKAPQPASSAAEGVGGRPGYLDGPLTIRCEYDQGPTMEVTDPLPFFGALVLALLVLAAATVAYRWARRPTMNQSTDQPAREVAR